MKYNDDELLNLLAGEYALGTLRGPARLRFERILEDEPAAREHLRDWEAHFATFTEDMAGETPPESVWNRIATALHFDEDAPSDEPASESKPSPNWWMDSRLWQGLAAGIVLALIVFTALRPEPAPTPGVQAEYISMMESSEGDDLWLLRAVPDRQRLKLQAISVPEISADNAYELWMLPDNEEAPVSLGLLPATGEQSVDLSSEQVAILEQSSTLAVSLEPAGGSPTGLPTGPVLYTAAVVRTNTTP